MQQRGHAVNSAPPTVAVSMSSQQEQRKPEHCFMKCGSPPAIAIDSDTRVAVELQWDRTGCLNMKNEIAPCFFFVLPVFAHRGTSYEPLTIAKDENGQPRHEVDFKN